jgi:hypothetical protein
LHIECTAQWNFPLCEKSGKNDCVQNKEPIAAAANLRATAAIGEE